MIAALKTLLLLVLLAGLGLSGFWVGQLLRGDHTLPDIQVADFLPPPPPPEDPDTDKGPYAVTPVVAPLARTVWTSALKVSEADVSTTITATIPSAEGQKIIVGQDVIFYTRHTQEPIAGIALVEAVEPDNDVIHVKFTKPDNLPLPIKRVTARIITMETVGTKQLPLSALFYDDAGNPYVWKLERTNGSDDEFAAITYPVMAGLKGDDYFEVGPEVQMGESVLANPPAGLLNGQTVTLDQQSIRTTAAVESLVEQARDIQRAKNTKELHARLQEYQDYSSGGANGGTRCDAPESGAALPASLGIDLRAPAPAPTLPNLFLKDLPSTPAMTAPSSGGGGCGGCGNSTY